MDLRGGIYNYGNFNYCEPTWGLLSFVGEFFNTFSSWMYTVFPLVHFSRVLYNMVDKGIPVTFLIYVHCFFALMMGISSFAFHATMLRVFESSEEIFGLLYMFLSLYMFSDILKPVTMGWMMLYIFLCAFMSGAGAIMTSIYYPFIFMYFVCVLAVLNSQYRVVFQTDNAHLNDFVKNIFTRQWVLYFIGMFLWFCDLFICDLVGSLKFHSLWHCLSSLSIYYHLLSYHVLYYHKVTEYLPVVRSNGLLESILPYIVLKKKLRDVREEDNMV